MGFLAQSFEHIKANLGNDARAEQLETPDSRNRTSAVLFLDVRDQRIIFAADSEVGQWREFRIGAPKEFEKHPDEHDRPGFRADTIEQGVLAKLQSFMADERTKWAIRSEITRRTKKAEANVGRLESQIEGCQLFSLSPPLGRQRRQSQQFRRSLVKR